MPEDRLAMAKRHVVEGRRIIEGQRQLISRLQSIRCSTAYSERILAEFERSQALFEDDLAEIEAKENK
jgi:hypothetical protein